MTHYGTAAAAFLYLLAILLASLFSRVKPAHIRSYFGITVTALIFTLGFIYFADSQRFARILYYIRHSFGTSFLGLLLSVNANINQKIMAGPVTILPALLIILLYKLYLQGKKNFTEDNNSFWLSNIIFCYLLVLPLYDQLLFGRFSLFIGLPLLFILMFILTGVIKNNLLKKSIITVLILGTFTMALGEFFGLKFHNRNKKEIYNDLMTVKEIYNFTKNDLIITKYGAEHICIWFLKAKSGLITSLNINDFDKYENIYILNPIEGSLNFMEIENTDTLSEANKYFILASNIPKPNVAKIVYESPYIQLLLLNDVPAEWKFDKNGNWLSYRK